MCGKQKRKAVQNRFEIETTTVLENRVSDDSIATSAIPHAKKVSEIQRIFQFAGDKLVVIDFYADWCRPCIQMNPILESWVNQYPDVLFIKANVDKANPQLIELYNISSIPTFIFVKKGKIVEEFTGGKYPELKDIIENHRVVQKGPKSAITTTTLAREGIISEKYDKDRRISDESDKRKDMGSTGTGKDGKLSTEQDNDKNGQDQPKRASDSSGNEKKE